MIESNIKIDEILNTYLDNMIGVITRTYYNTDYFKQFPEKYIFLETIHKNHWHYFSNSELRRVGDECWPLEADSMIGVYRMRNVKELMQNAIENNIEGDFVETGVWKGGACVMANAVIYETNQQSSRRVHVFDSFEGLPEPYMTEDAGDSHHTIDCLAISLDTVKKVFSSYGLLTENVIFRKGWFKDTMKNTDDIDKIAILRLDGDMYSSTIEVLEALYNKVPVGGFIIVDDWLLPGARKAVIDFANERSFIPNMIHIDKNSCYWIKEKI